MSNLKSCVSALEKKGSGKCRAPKVFFAGIGMDSPDPKEALELEQSGVPVLIVRFDGEAALEQDERLSE